MKKLKIVLLSILGLIALLLITIHLILTFKAKELLQEVVKEASHGKYSLEAKNVTFFYSHAGINASKLKLIPTTEEEGQASIEFEKVEIRLESVMHLVFDRQLAVQKIEFLQPSIVAYAKKKEANTEKKDISETIQTAQQKLFDLIDILNVKNLTITDAGIKIFTNDSAQKKYFSVNHFNLNLHDIDIEKAQNGGKPIFKLDGKLNFDHPDIHLPDSTISASLANLTASIANYSLQIDSLELNISGGEVRQPQSVKLSMIKIANMHWSRYLQEGILEFDSLVAKSGNADITVLKKQQQHLGDTNTSKKKYTGNSIIIHHAWIGDISYNLHAKKEKNNTERQLTMKLQGDSLHLKELSIINGREPAFSVEALNVGIKDFTERDEKGSQSISLKGLSINKQSLLLKQYVFETNKNEQNKNYLRVSIPNFSLNNYLLEDIFQKRLVASSITMDNPDIIIDIRKEKPKTGGPKKNINTTVSGLMQSVSKKVTLGEIVIKNGNFTLLPTLSPDDKVSLTGLSLVVDATKLPKITSAMDMIHAVKELTSTEFLITGKNIHLNVRGMQLLNNPRGLHFESIAGQFGDGKAIQLNGVTVLNRNAAFDPTQSEGLHISDLLVESGTVTISGAKKTTKSNASKNPSPVIKVDNLGLQNIVFKLNQGDKIGISSALNIRSKDLELKENNLFWTTLNVDASKTDAALQKTTFDAGSMTISQPGIIHIKQAKGKTTTASAAISFSTEALDIAVGFTSTGFSSLKIKELKLTKPILNLILQKKDSNLMVSKKAAKPITKDISLETLEMVQPTIDITIKDVKGKETNTHRVFTGTFILKNLQTLDQQKRPSFSAEKIIYFTNAPKSNIGGRLIAPSYLAISASNFVYNPVSKQFSMLIDSAYLRDISQSFIGKKQDTIDVNVGEVGVANFLYAKGDSLTLKHILGKANLWVKKMDLTMSSPKQTIRAWNIKAGNKQSMTLSLDSFAILPRKSKEEVWASTPYEKGYDIITGGNIEVEGIDINSVNEKPQVNISKLRANHIHFKTEKDKTKLEDTIDYRPLLVRQILQIPLPMKIDSVLLSNARVDAHEISKKTGKKTHIYFTELNGYVSNVKTHDIKETDTLDMRVRSRFFGTDVVRVHFKQSYYDTLQGFWMRVRMSNFHLPEMNKLLTPLMGLKIEKGNMDSLLLVANGNDYFAFGTMDLRYHGLKARLLKTEDTKGKFFVSIANFFTGILLRTHDNGRTNLLYKERVQKRSIFNFWGKIALEGLLTNLNIKRDKAERKKFEKAIEKYNLPGKYWQDDDDDK